MPRTCPLTSLTSYQMENMKITLKIQNFGPISKGYNRNDGYINFTKVMVLCGPQGAGKSCIAKLFSVFSWIEKALVRGDFSEKYLVSYNRFVNIYCAYQNIQSYFNDDTFLHYCGMAYEMKYERGKLEVSATGNEGYLRPQITYIPAERIILSVLEKAENVKGLPAPLNTLMDEFAAASRNMKGSKELPINHVSYRYDKLNKRAWIESDNYSLKLSESSSGMQSVTPLFIVLDYLSRNIGVKDTSKSLREREEIKKRIDEVLKDDTLDAETRQLLIGQISDNSNKYLLSIVEEPEQNLYPSSQRHILNSLLAINSAANNQLIITTHSPYILNYLSLSIKAGSMLSKLSPSKVDLLDKIVPITSVADGKDVSVLEISEDGIIKDLVKYDGMPSDENVLNMFLAECNDSFGQLLEIEDSL